MNTQIKDGGPAFPIAEERWVDKRNPTLGSTNFDGMTLRDYFAAKFLQGALSGNNLSILGANSAVSVERAAYLLADRMLAAREVQS